MTEDTGQMRDRITLLKQELDFMKVYSESQRKLIDTLIEKKDALRADRDKLRDKLTEIAHFKNADPFADEECQAVARAALRD